MSLETIKQSLVRAAQSRINPSFTIHSYRGGEWTLVASFLDPISTAETYHSFAVRGTWGNYIEVRLDGVRVSL